MSETHTSHRDDRLLELLADQALDALTPATADELDRLITFVEPTFDLECLERAVAAVSVALIPEEPMPTDMRARLEGVAESWAARIDVPSPPSPPDSEPVAGRIRPAPRRGPSPLGVAGWFVAAAALVFAAAVWVTRPQGPVSYASAPLAEQRQKLIDTAPDLVRIPWTTTGDAAAPGPVRGEVVWSDKLNRGYMTFKGLTANNPGRHQYQLWIFDKDRDERYPVDGGVFDIPAPNETTIVTVDPHLHVDHATLFAVTVEKPGGVVVSSREHVAVLAKPS